MQDFSCDKIIHLAIQLGLSKQFRSIFGIRSLKEVGTLNSGCRTPSPPVGTMSQVLDFFFEAFPKLSLTELSPTEVHLYYCFNEFPLIKKVGQKVCH